MKDSIFREVVLPLIFVIIFVSLFSAIVINANQSGDKATEFRGVCNYLGGQVHDNLCIKGDRVVLRQKP